MVDADSRTVAVRYEIPNPEHQLRIGLFVDVGIETAQTNETLAIPESALVDEDGRPTVYVQVDGESFQKRDVELGIRDGDFVEVKQGLQDRRTCGGERGLRDPAGLRLRGHSRPRSYALTVGTGHVANKGSSMLNAIIHWSLTNRVAVLVLSGLLLAVGGYVASTMPVDVFPDLTAPTVTVITEAHGMAPGEVETLVTFPIEATMNGAANVRRVRSATAVGISVVWVEFEWGTDIYAARQVVTEKLSLVSGALPPEVERPILAPISSIMGEILFLSLTSDRHDGIELRTVADTVIRRRLLSVAGVSQVTPIGGGEKQYQVVLSPSKLQAYQISVAEVAKHLAETNQNASAGFLVQGGQELLIQGIGRVRTPSDIADTVVAVRDEVPIRVGQLGVVQVGEAIKRGEGSAQGKPAVILGIQKQPGANTLELTKTLDETLDEIQATLPEGMKIDKNIFRQANFIEVAVRNVEDALRDGGILVVLVVVVFLANLRASVITLLAIPLSLVTAVLTLKFMGATINTMTLGGMAIAIGALGG